MSVPTLRWIAFAVLIAVIFAVASGTVTGGV